VASDHSDVSEAKGGKRFGVPLHFAGGSCRRRRR
jgi:hypothetical protein